MENSMFSRQELLTSAVKQKMISSFITKDTSKSSQKSFEDELTCQSFTREKDLDESEIFSYSFDQSRPSSQKNAQRKAKLTEKPSLNSQTIPSSYSAALKNFKEKLSHFNESLKNENTDYLLFSFIVIFKGIWPDREDSSALNFVQSNIWSNYREILAKDDLPKQITAIPRMIRMRKVPETELKKSLTWFSMVKYQKLETLKELYDFIRETFLYARKFYFFSIILPDCASKSQQKKIVGVRPDKENSQKFRTPSYQPRSSSNKALTSSMNKTSQLSKKEVKDLTKAFKSFWLQNSLKSKEEIFKSFKSQSSTPLNTEASLFIISQITSKLQPNL